MEVDRKGWEVSEGGSAFFHCHRWIARFTAPNTTPISPPLSPILAFRACCLLVRRKTKAVTIAACSAVLWGTEIRLRFPMWNIRRGHLGPGQAGYIPGGEKHTADRARSRFGAGSVD